jgi:hypothetical protein
MEQFDTDDKLLKESNEEKKSTTITCGQLLLILLCCAISLCALYYLFKSVKTANIPKTSQFDLSN